ncbi:hypothetical protein YPF_3008 [Yersinia pestis biovar Orientalis str. India 195]|nr:hypothetical protein YP516_2312 [Yersinia pestis Nepal516]EEO80192.1 hypothetical protein YPF_3008 [Yersinia pestis biovar Orientalis str. India 195]EEO84424.1 hypothetical protein YPH_0237 [Yersinia pestis biovar Orientalis str. PEXU2]EEO89722.1 hypothetical protein YPS_2996 [Yersinia pestis Pestoides A]
MPSVLLAPFLATFIWCHQRCSLVLIGRRIYQLTPGGIINWIREYSHYQVDYLSNVIDNKEALAESL